MTPQSRRVLVLVALTCLLLPALANAQSQLTGVVKDTSEGVLPGVLVEASSPVLIEGTRTATTDEQGRFQIVDIRPGEYTLTFTLTGFQVVKRDKVVVPAERTVVVNELLRLGAVTEALTVSGNAPVVDVQNAVKVTSLARDTLDMLPIGNNIWEMAQMIPAIDIFQSYTHQGSTVGGNNGMNQVFMSVHGSDSGNTILVDGLTASGLELGGIFQAYFNNDMNAEVTYQTSGIQADRSGGGATVNMIPREGGNRFSGNFKASARPAGWIGSNLTTRLAGMGVTNPSSVRYLADETISQGGPILRDKVWFFGSFHQFNTSDLVAETRFDDGRQGFNDGEMRQYSIRLTWQASPRNKVNGYYDKTNATEKTQMGSNDDPETASRRQTSPNYGTGNAKWMSTVTSRLLFEAGYSFNQQYEDRFGQPGIAKARGTAEWYATASRAAQTGGALTTAPATFLQSWPARYNYQGSINYVSGAHQIKAGLQWQTGRFFHSTDANADLTQVYDTQALVGNEWVLTTPVEVDVRNTPVTSRETMNADLGIYAQDSWRLKRLTINAGLRWEHVNAQADAWTAPEGRFVPARSVPAVRNVPDWYDWAPRFSAVYDLFGDARTAIKYVFNRYNRSTTTTQAQGFNVLSATTVSLPWIDGNGDNIAQGGRTFTYNPDGSVKSFLNCGGVPFPTAGICEIDMALLDPTGAIFGTPAATSTFEGFPRAWNTEQSFEVQHALTRRFSLTGAYTTRANKDITQSGNALLQEGDYVPVKIFNPIDGSPITAWSVKDAATRTRLRTTQLSSVNHVEPTRRSTYRAYALEFNVRPYAGASVFGGFEAEQSLSYSCEDSYFVRSPTSLRFCDSWNYQGTDDHGIFQAEKGPSDTGGKPPFAKDFRMGVSLPLPWYGLNLGVSYLNNDSSGYNPTFSIVPTGSTATRYTDGNPTGTSALRKVASQTAPACVAPCPAGQLVFDPAGNLAAAGLTSFITTSASSTTAYSVELYPSGRIRRERLNQLDLKLSKTFRVRGVSVLPTFEAYNVFNSDTIFFYSSGSWATTAGNYLIPNNILQARIIGAGVQVRW
jgi:hypothetical protein